MTALAGLGSLLAGEEGKELPLAANDCKLPARRRSSSSLGHIEAECFPGLGN